MADINVVQSFWNFAQFKKIKKEASSQNLMSLSQKTKIQGNNVHSFQKVWEIALLIEQLGNTFSPESEGR